jgi:hypothetical protein
MTEYLICMDIATPRAIICIFSLWNRQYMQQLLDMISLQTIYNMKRLRLYSSLITAIYIWEINKIAE